MLLLNSNIVLYKNINLLRFFNTYQIYRFNSRTKFWFSYFFIVLTIKDVQLASKFSIKHPFFVVLSKLFAENLFIKKICYNFFKLGRMIIRLFSGIFQLPHLCNKMCKIIVISIRLEILFFWIHRKKRHGFSQYHICMKGPTPAFRFTLSFLKNMGFHNEYIYT